MRPYFFAAIAASVVVGGVFAIACSASSDNTVYGPPDAGQPDANYCITDQDCPSVDGGDQACGYPIADTCQARGLCVEFFPTAQKCATTNKYCGCNGDIVSSCAIADGYVGGGPTNGQHPTALADGGVGCNLGSGN